MRVRVAKLDSRMPSPWELYSLFLLIGAAVYIPLSHFIWLPPVDSPLRKIGLACPFCGGTRAVISLCLGDPVLAFRYNPFAVFVFVMLVWGAVSFFFLVLPARKRVVVDATRRQIALFWTLVGLVVLANWAYVLWAGMYNVPLEV